MYHDCLAAAVAILCLWAIISPRVPTGVIVTAGLGVLAVSAIWSIDDGHDPWAAMDGVLLGSLLIGVAMAWRLLKVRQAAMRRANDWRPDYAQTLPPRDHAHVAGGKGEP